MARVELRAQQIDLRTDWSQRAAAIGTVFAVIAAFVTIFFTTRTAQDQAALTERGQVTDRFSKAVDQLGSDQLNVRLGGIYALERIANDSPSDRENIDEILTAFLRQPPRPAPPDPRRRAGSPRAAADVQGAVTVLGRVPTRPGRVLDLADARLTWARMHDAELSGVIFTSANLNSADFTGANLTGADLSSADLQGANLDDADLTGADLTGANLTGANLTWVNLTRGRLTGANLTGADLSWINLAGADLTGANLTGADLTGANLDGVVGLPQESARSGTTGPT